MTSDPNASGINSNYPKETIEIQNEIDFVCRNLLEKAIKRKNNQPRVTDKFEKAWRLRKAGRFKKGE